MNSLLVLSSSDWSVTVWGVYHKLKAHEYSDKCWVNHIRYHAKSKWDKTLAGKFYYTRTYCSICIKYWEKYKIGQGELASTFDIWGLGHNRLSFSIWTFLVSIWLKVVLKVGWFVISMMKNLWFYVNDKAASWRSYHELNWFHLYNDRK